MKQASTSKIFSSRYLLILVLLISFGFLNGCGKQKAHIEPTPGDSTDIIPPPGNNSLPSLKGKLLYHSYINYGDESKMYIYDFTLKQLTCISDGWNLHDPMNGDFSSDGRYIVFMAQAAAKQKWDIFLYEIGSNIKPINLTAGNANRNEDPKFSQDGKSICFKSTPPQSAANLFIMDLHGNISQQVTHNDSESGMPYFVPGGKMMLYARGAGASSDIYRVNIDGTNNIPIQKEVNLQEYYPIAVDSASYLFTRWYSISNKNDQVYAGYLSGRSSVRLLFNSPDANYSDPFPFDKEYVFLSSTKNGSAGGYDLYIANTSSGQIWSLASFNKQINTAENELGACYHAE
jgi:Tol biopolymer transport system component